MDKVSKQLTDNENQNGFRIGVLECTRIQIKKKKNNQCLEMIIIAAKVSNINM